MHYKFKLVSVDNKLVALFSRFLHSLQFSLSVSFSKCFFARFRPRQWRPPPFWTGHDWPLAFGQVQPWTGACLKMNQVVIPAVKMARLSPPVPPMNFSSDSWPASRLAANSSALELMFLIFQSLKDIALKTSVFIVQCTYLYRGV